MGIQGNNLSASKKGNGCGRVCGINMSGINMFSQKAILTTFSLMTLCLILLLACEITTPSTTNTGRLRAAEELIHYNVVEAVGEKLSAIWELTEQVDGSGERSLNAWQSDSEDLDADPGKKPTSRATEPVVVSITKRNEHPSFEASGLSPSPSSSKHAWPGKGEGPSSSEWKSSVLPDSQPRTESNAFERQQCDFTAGKWVKDERRPFYSGNECKAYLSGGFACRQMNRLDFDYEKLRWQPNGCDLPPFTSKGVLQRLRNRVVAFIGDSLGRQQFQSLMCMLTGGKTNNDVEDVESHWGPTVKWAHRFRSTNTTVLFHWTSSLCDIELGNSNELPGHSAMHLDRPDSFLKENLRRLDVVVLNTGHHWNRGKMESNRWHFYVGGKRNTNRKLDGMAEAYNFAVHNVIQWLDAELVGNSSRAGVHQPVVYMRTLSPRHFKNGEWNSGGTCDAIQYVAPAPSKTAEAALPQRAYTGPVTEQVAENAVKGTIVNLLNITHLSKFREEGHISKYGKGKDSRHQDCLHWCLPGVPDVWNELLYGHLLSNPQLSL